MAINLLAPPADKPVTWDWLRRRVNDIASDTGNWAGLPLPVEHVPLVMEERHPFAHMNGAKLGGREPEEVADYTIVNQWIDRRSHPFPVQVWICREADGRHTCCRLPVGARNRMKMALDTLGIASAHPWTVAAEERAATKLKELVTETAYRCYMLTGTFLETSKRSRVTYLFRKLRPTVALRDDNGEVRFLAALCLHPIGYYAGTWAGVMVPTDDVISHLTMMRADEAMFWRKCNHHALHSDEAGI
jgi:hypothetical protein